MDFDIEKVIQSYGNLTRAAKAFGVSRTTVYQWKEKGVPQQILTAYQLGKISVVLNKDGSSSVSMPMDKIESLRNGDSSSKQVANGIDIDALRSALKPLIDELVEEKLKYSDIT
jgi:DNA-binding XRE family transcriptional regulator